MPHNDHSGLMWLSVIQIAVDPEITDWIHKSNIDYNIVVNNFLKTLYKSGKFEINNIQT